MSDKHKLVIERRKLRYEIDIQYKCSIIVGESGTGKTLMCKMIDEWVKLGNGYTPIRVSSDLKVTVVHSFEELNNVISNGYRLVVIDEAYFNHMVDMDSGESVAKLLRGTGIYCIFITRRKDYTCLPADVTAYYKLCNTYRDNKTVLYNELLYTRYLRG